MTDFRALCAELVEKLHGYASANPHHDSDELVARARTQLAQPEPEGMTDEGLEVVASQFCDFHHAHMSSADEWRCSRSGLTTFARAVLARRGRPTPQPQRDADASTVIPWLLEMAVMAANSDSPYSAGMLTLAAQLIGEGVDEDAPSPPVDGEVADLVAWLRSIKSLQAQRAATLLLQRQHLQPVPVSERLPGPGDLHPTDQWCWVCGQDCCAWHRVTHHFDAWSYWLPAHALPVPTSENV